MDGFHDLNYYGYTLKMHHGRSFKEEGGELLYSGGEILRWDIDPDKVFITHMVKELEKMWYKGNLEVVLCRVHGKGLKDGLFEVYKDSSVIQVIGQLLDHKHCQLYVKHKTDPHPNPKAFQQHKATKAATEEGDEATEGGALGRKGVDVVVDRAAKESEDNSSGSDSDFAFGDVPADLSEEDDLELQDIRSQVQIAKGLVQAVVELLPHIEHRMCARYIYANWSGSRKGPKIQSFYMNEMFLEAHGKVMEPVRDPKFWDRTNMHEPPIPLVLKKKKCRPKKLRRRTVLETTVGKDGVEQMSCKGTTNTCNLCRQPGHNKRRCNLRGKDNIEPAVCGSANPIPTVQESSRPESVGELIVAREADESR
ncbi:hypothetical protein CRG98_043676 [Punica granatum]|uniref:PB1-like domain-containing protein n=1 Tax=Punica granatum TaxID=22663 RepID=A0A2I0HW61_PUNGR|nr:hypothetical protein CRG98_043676 [Punica granatum]